MSTTTLTAPIRSLIASATVALGLLLVSGGPLTWIIKSATDWDAEETARAKDGKGASTSTELVDVADGLTAPLFGIALAVTPLTILAGAIAMQLGSQKGPRIIGVGVIGFAIVGSVQGIVA